MLAIVQRELADRALTVYVTGRLDALPSYGRDVVAITVSDEWSLVPAYTHDVLATFKPYGIRPALGGRPLRHPSYLNLVLLLKTIGTLPQRLPAAVRYALRSRPPWMGGRGSAAVFDLPLGYGNQHDLPVVPLAERRHDVFFAGSVEQRSYPTTSLRYWLKSPKTIARQRMLRALERLAARHPAIDVKLALSSSFVLNAIAWGRADPAEVFDAETYSATLMNTKICLVPRGTSPETFRFFEGLRYGCVLITERLPSRWFYDGAPIIQVDDWRQAETLIPALLADPARMQSLHERALDWWHTHCSEEAVAAYMVHTIRTLLDYPQTPALP